MKPFGFANVLLSLALVWLPLQGQGYIVSSSSSPGSIVSPISSSYYTSATSRTFGTTTRSDETLSTIVSSIIMEPTTTLIPSTTVKTIIWLTTITQTSFVPVSSLVTQSGSLIYYSTWLVPIYPVTVTTSTEYIAPTIETITTTILSTTSPRTTPSVTYECICPAPETETVYLLATIGPPMAITSAVIFPWNSMTIGPQAITETVLITTTALPPAASSEISSAAQSSIFLAPGPVIISTMLLPDPVAK